MVFPLASLLPTWGLMAGGFLSATSYQDQSNIQSKVLRDLEKQRNAAERERKRKEDRLQAAEGLRTVVGRQSSRLSPLNTSLFSAFL